MHTYDGSLNTLGGHSRFAVYFSSICNFLVFLFSDVGIRCSRDVEVRCRSAFLNWFGGFPGFTFPRTSDSNSAFFPNLIVRG